MSSQLLRMLLCLAAFLSLIAAVNLVANPYGAWPVTLIDRTYLRVAVGDERLATPYRARAESPAVLLIGTSRILYGMWIEQGYRDGVLNAGLSGATIDEVGVLLDLALRNPRLQRIIWTVDFQLFSETHKGFADRPTYDRLAGDLPRQVRETLFSTDALRRSGSVLLRAVGGRARLPADRLRPVPWPPSALREELEAIEASGSNGPHGARTEQHLRDWLEAFGRQRRSPEQWALFRRAVQRVRARGVDLTVLVAPLSVYELEAIRQSGAWSDFVEWKRELASITPYWDFSGYNAVAMHDALYTFPIFCHFKAPVGHALLRGLLGEDCRDCGPLAQALIESGVWVEPGTVDAHLAAQETAREQLAASSPRYSPLIAKISGIAGQGSSPASVSANGGG